MITNQQRMPVTGMMQLGHKQVAVPMMLSGGQMRVGKSAEQVAAEKKN